MPHTVPRIKAHLESKGFQIVRVFHLAEVDPTLDTLALLIAFQFPILGPLLQHMRGNIRESPGFYHDLDPGLSPNEVGSIKGLCQILKANGLIESWKLQNFNTRIFGLVAGNKRAFVFLTGGWLEHAVRFFIQQFLNLEGHEVEIGQNVQVKRPDGRIFEMDLLLWIDDTLYWWEAKAGGYQQEQLERYGEVRVELGLVRKHCTLVLGDPPEEKEAIALARRIGFNIITPDRIPLRVEEIEGWHRSIL